MCGAFLKFWATSLSTPSGAASEALSSENSASKSCASKSGSSSPSSVAEPAERSPLELISSSFSLPFLRGGRLALAGAAASRLSSALFVTEASER